VVQGGRLGLRVHGPPPPPAAPQGPPQLVQALLHQPELRKALEREARAARLVR
jgi:hypothetical protein